MSKLTRVTALDAWMEAENLTERDVGRLIDVSQQSVNRYRRGQSIPDHDTMVRLFQVSSGRVGPSDFYATEDAGEAA